jgi:hypothetical protein
MMILPSIKDDISIGELESYLFNSIFLDLGG